MPSRRTVVSVLFVLLLVPLLSGLAAWILWHTYRVRAERLADLGVLAQQDAWGRTTQINFWPPGIDQGAFAELAHYPHVRLLNLSACDIQDHHLEPLTSLPRLEELILTGTPITDAGLPVIARCGQLERVVLTSADVTAEGVRKLAQPRPDLNVVINPLALHGLGHLLAYGGHGELNGAYELVSLDLHQAPVTDADMEPVLSCENLTMVNLSGTQVGDAGVNCLRNVTALRELWLTGTKVTDACTATISTMSELRALSLARTEISDEGVARLAALPHLEVLHVGETRVSDEGIRHLGKLQHLKEVYVTQSLVTTDGADALAEAIPAVEVFGGSVPETPVEDIESRVLG